MHGFARHCQDSLYAVFRTLGLELRELEGWNCCGATTYISIDENQALTLAARNLALAERARGELVAPCNACFMVLKKTQDYLARYQELRARILPVLDKAGLHYEGKVKIRHPLEILLRDVGVKALKERVTRPLTGWKVAPYYGCLLVRPYALDNGFTLDKFDAFIPALGATLVDFEFKARCCGGSLTGTIEEVGERLVYILLQQAKRCNADVMVTVCPLCQLNLEAHQSKIVRRYGEDVKIPVPYFTQLIGLALGIPSRELGLEKLLVPLREELISGVRGGKVPAMTASGRAA